MALDKLSQKVDSWELIVVITTIDSSNKPIACDAVPCNRRFDEPVHDKRKIFKSIISGSEIKISANRFNKISFVSE